MPRIARLSATEIATYFADHPPPHFHMLGREGAAQIEIESLEILVTSGCIDLREALAWASQNLDLLRAKRSDLSEAK